MPTGTRSSISVKRTRKPMTATASVLILLLDRLDDLLARERTRRKDEPVGADRDQQHRRDIAYPGEGEERPVRQPQIESEDVVLIGREHLVEQRIGLHRDDE